MTHTPKNENGKMRSVATLLFFGGLICLILSPLALLLPHGYWQLVGMVCWGACAYILVRFVLTAYIYRIEPHSPYAEHPLAWEMDFTVDRVQGKRPLPMIRVSLKQLKDVFYVGNEDYRTLPEYIDYRGARVYNYAVNANRKNRYMIVFSAGEEEYHAVLFEPSGEMLAYLNRAKTEIAAE